MSRDDPTRRSFEAYTGLPMTLGNMRANGVRTLDAWCLGRGRTVDEFKAEWAGGGWSRPSWGNWGRLTVGTEGARCDGSSARGPWSLTDC